MRQMAILAPALVVAIAWACLAQTPPATAPAPAVAPASQPATAPAVEPATLKILEGLEQAGKDHPALRAEMTYTVVDPILETKDIRHGWVAFQRGAGEQSDRFRIHFADRQMEGEAPVVDKIDYAFDGAWLTVVKHSIANMKRYQYAAKGERVPLSLRGPFPLPFGQPVSEVLSLFEPTTTAPPGAAKGPDGTTYVRLTTRPDAKKDLRFRTLEMWVDAKLNLPVQIVAVEDKKKTLTIAFKDVQTPAKVEDDVFVMPKLPGYSLSEERWQGSTDLKP
ncbi:MAG: outer membrane lipoprotein carrier protein LolA [Planctomycetota bacterium]|nr:outer membrane lipoprotein carrier protein LolA [Planctomycetota bacterium]